MDMRNKKYIFQLIREFKKTQSENIYKELSLAFKVDFKKDEQNYIESQYHDLNPHRAMHEEMIRALLSFKTEFINRQQKNQKNIAEFITFLRLWIKVHEKEMDSFADAFLRINKFIKKHEK